jgi:dipeptidyl aminopeptidase/acylaminoacyl peptidase
MPLINRRSFSVGSLLCLVSILAVNLSAAEQTELSLKQIMADPDWIGNSPESMYWDTNSTAVYYLQKRTGSTIKDRYQLQLASNKAQMLKANELASSAYRQYKTNPDKTRITYVHQGNIFVKVLATNKLIQITKDNKKQSKPMFIGNDKVAFREANSIYTHDLNTGLTELLFELKLTTAPIAADKANKDFYSEQQLRYFEYIRDQKQQKLLTKEHKDEQLLLDETRSERVVYLGKGIRLDNISVSPTGDYAVIVTAKLRKNIPDKMPRFVTDDGYVDVDNVRAKVGTQAYNSETIHLLEIETAKLTKISLDNLPDIKTNRFYKIDKEVGKLKPKKKLATNRALWVHTSSSFGIDWNEQGSHALLNLRAADNKDRWLVSLSVEDKDLATEHHLHDPAWVNTRVGVQYGWVDNKRLYFLSEQSGYSQLYLKTLGKKAKALTKGEYVVENITLSNDKAFAYFTANKDHPGHFDVFRVALADQNIQRLTELGGLTEYRLSPDNQQLLILHSSFAKPPELFVQKVTDSASIRQLTDSTTDAFKAIDWQVPEIVEIKSSHVDKPIYARLYKPSSDKGFKAGKRPAVIFTHGAGYLHNAHGGWSLYFREFMFHNLLAEQGYVVLDPDYRASRGYGRDWRTAIYRQMGTPEVQDLKDAVAWLGETQQVDTGRVGTYGGSYGGFLTFMALFTEPELFQAGASLRPVTDWAHYNHGYTSNILNTPERDPIAYKRSSPIEYAEGLNKPLLIAHGMVDSNVVFQDTVRLVQRLIELEKQDFETAIYPIEGHGFKTASSWLDEYRRIYKLFEQHVK